MKAYRLQIFVIFLGIGLVFLLYKFGKTVAPPQADKASPNAPMAKSSSPAINFNDLKINALQGVPADISKEIMRLDDKTDSSSYRKLAELWKKAQRPNLVAKYNGELAKLENSEKNLTFASRYFLDLLELEQEPQVRTWQANEAIVLLEQAQKLNPESEELKTMLATCYVDGTGETMKGVQLLLGVTRNNPGNIEAGLILGRLAIQSQQFDKGITRLEALLQKHPNNTEVMYFLAECYKGRGQANNSAADIAKAKDLFNTCKSKVKNPDFAKEIDNYIKTF